MSELPPTGTASTGAADRVALVVGGHRGIGGATAARLRASGHTVLVIDILASPDDPDAIAVDLTDAAATREAVESLGERHGRIDVLILAAGIKVPGTVGGSLPLEVWDQTYAVNVRPLFVCVDAALPYLRRGTQAAIVTIASASGHAERGALAYASSKGAVLTFTRSLALDLLPDRIRVNAVMPGYTQTDMARGIDPAFLARKQAENVSGRIGQPEDVAAAICYLVGPDSLTVSGTVLDVGHVQGAFVDSRTLSTPS